MKLQSNKKGVTLIELIVVIALIAVVITAVWPMFSFSDKAHQMTVDEFTLQSDLRLTAQNISNFVRHGSIVFLWTEETYTSKAKTDGWNYLTLEDDHTRIVNWVWDSTTSSHVPHTIAEASEGIYYGLDYSKNDPSDTKIEFKLDAYARDTNTLKLSVSSELIALNSLTIDDTGNADEPSSIIVYKTEMRPRPETITERNQVKTAITLVLDVSGSMGKNMDGNNPTYSNPSRINILKNKANSLIDKFVEIGNVEVCIVPFSSHANPRTSHPGTFLSVDDSESELRSQITNLNALGGTNTGDGMRRAYHYLNTYNLNNSDEEIMNYMMVLMDGNPTYWSTNTSTPTDYQYNDQNLDEIKGIGIDIALGGRQTIYDEILGISFTVNPLNQTAVNNNLNSSMSYVQAISTHLIVTSPLDINTFVIGFSNVESQIDRAELVAGPSYTNGTYYSASSDIELEAVFTEFVSQILVERWHIYGP